MPEFDFGTAILLMNTGERVTRAGWNGKGMYLFFVDTIGTACVGAAKEEDLLDGEIWYQPHIVMRTADGKFVPWLASQSDILAKDWIKEGE